MTAVAVDRARPPAPRLPSLVVDAAAAAAGVEGSVMARAVELALTGDPDRAAPGWWEQAACRGDDAGGYYPRSFDRDAKSRLATCRTACPVQSECLAAALALGEREGLWGGTTGAGRRRLRQVLRDAGVMGVTGEEAHIAWREPGADRQPPTLHETRPTVPAPWAHQTAAVNAIAAAIGHGGDCQVAIATASGKTLIGAWAAARLDVARVLVMVPNLALIAQTAEVWASTEHWRAARTLAVCSDTGEVDLPSTTDPAAVRAFLEHADGGRAVVFATYQSSPVLVDAGCRFDLAVADEAHHLAGVRGKAFAAIVRGEIPAQRRLYMTATPRRFTRRARDVELLDMGDDVGGAFGPRVFDFGLGDAIDAGVIADYRVVVAAVERGVFDRVASRPDLADIDPHLLAGAIAVVRAMGELGLTSCLSFHSRVDRARNFAQLVGAVAEALPAARPAGPGWAGWVQGASSVRIRRRLLARLADPRTWAVLGNARALGEGVDIPVLDAVAIVDPKTSETDILQATGRVLRRAGNKVGTIILPVLLTADEPGSDDPLAGADDRSLSLVGGVLRALRAHDTDLGARLDSAQRATARDQARTRVAHPELSARLRRSAARRLLRSRIELWVPGGATGDLADAMALRLVREAAPGWEAACGRLLAWIDTHGTARVPQTTKVPDETGTFALGAWCTVQRGLHRRGLLAPERAQRLDQLPGWEWDPRDTEWSTNVEALADYHATHGRWPRNGTIWQGRKVGQFLNTVRTAYKNGDWLTADRVTALEAIPGWVWNQRHADWEDHYNALANWASANGHARPSHGELVDGFDIGRWAAKQRVRLRNGDMRPERAAKLRGLPGWVDHARDAMWEDGYARLSAWIDANSILPPQKQVLDDGFTLGLWVATQRERWRGGRLDPARARRLEALRGWEWDPHGDSWSRAHAQLLRLARAADGGPLRIPEGKIDGFDLGGWATNQRRAHSRGDLSPERVAALERVPGWTWSVPDARFDTALEALRSFAAREGHCEPPTDHRENGIGLRAWVYRLRRERQAGQLPEDRARRLEAITRWTWDPPTTPAADRATAWDQAHQRLVDWTVTHGTARIPTKTVLNDGFRLGSWVNKQRTRHHAGTLDPARARRLEALPGWTWATRGPAATAPPTHDRRPAWTATVAIERTRHMATHTTDTMTNQQLAQTVQDQRHQLDRWHAWQEDLATVLADLGVLDDVIARIDATTPPTTAPQPAPGHDG